MAAGMEEPTPARLKEWEARFHLDERPDLQMQLTQATTDAEKIWLSGMIARRGGKLYQCAADEYCSNPALAVTPDGSCGQHGT
jgi:hypothetical protein